MAPEEYQAPAYCTPIDWAMHNLTLAVEEIAGMIGELQEKGNRDQLQGDYVSLSRPEALRISKKILKRGEKERIALADEEAGKGIQYND